MLSKILGIGTVERKWKQVKDVKSGQHVNTTIDKTKKQVLVYPQYQQMRAQARHCKLSSAGKLWDDSDFASMKMDQYCKEIKDSLDANNNVDTQEQPVQIVRLWEESWEQKKIGPRGDAIPEAKLTAKYQGLKFYDIDSDDNKILTVHRMVFRKERAKNSYYVFGIFPGFNHDLPDDSTQNDLYWQP